MRSEQHADIHSYPLAPNCEDVEILRVVIRESLSGDLVRKLIVDILST
jgi:glutamate decarboxylase